MFLILSQDDHPLYERRFPLKKTTLGSYTIIKSDFTYLIKVQYFNSPFQQCTNLKYLINEFQQFWLQQLLNAQFILHASLDVFEEKYKSSKELFLKEIEQKQDYRIFGYVTPSNIRFLILTDQEEEKVKGFCQLAHEQLIKVLMNPLYQLGSSISSSNFDHVIQQLLQTRLNQ